MRTTSNLRAVYCQNTHCPESAFEGALFWHGLYRHAVPLAFAIRLFSPGFFRDDLDLIRHLASDVSMGEVDEDIDRFEYGNRVRRHWLRTGFRIRVNPTRLAALAAKHLPQ